MSGKDDDWIKIEDCYCQIETKKIRHNFTGGIYSETHKLSGNDEMLICYNDVQDDHYEDYISKEFNLGQIQEMIG